MRLYFILALCFLAHIIFSQVICKGVLTDGETASPVEFANIGIIGKGIGTVSNENGQYSFTVPDSLSGALVKISMLGYKAKNFSVKNLQALSMVRLARSSTQLNEVSVSAKKIKVKVLGNKTKTKTVSAGFRNNSLGAEIGIKLSVKHPQTHIRKVMININANTLDALPVFRFNVYKVDDKGLPGENMLSQNIIIVPVEKTGYIEFDLTPYTIFVDQDVFISIEWIKDLGDAKGLYFSTKLVGNSTYYRQVSQDKWQKINSIGVGLHAEVAY